MKHMMLMILGIILQSCYFVDYFNPNAQEEAQNENARKQAPSVIGNSLGNRAGNAIQSALDAVYQITSKHPPASLRPDPDMYPRRLLLRFRTEGVDVARELGLLEDYRSLLGGASIDFQTPPQTEYDATSYLASLNLAQRICTSLINPNTSNYPTWQSILPHPPEEKDLNIKYLAGKLLGIPGEKVPQEKIDQLKNLLERDEDTNTLVRSSYIPVCTALTLDAEGLLL